MKKGNTPIVNGIILAAICVYLGWYFTNHQMWNPATVVILIILALMAAGQFVIWYMFFRNPKNNRKNK